MKSIKIRRGIVTAIVVLVCFLLQCMLFPHLALASIKPHLMLIGFFSGLIIDIQFGNILGFYALIYLLIGYVNGLFEQMYFDEDIKLPLILISASEFVYGLVIYLLMFLLRSEFDFLHYLSHIIIPELIYTIAVTLPLYPAILFINHKLDAEEKRSASKFV